MAYATYRTIPHHVHMTCLTFTMGDGVTGDQAAKQMTKDLA